MSESDQAELDRTNQEQGIVQKQLDGHRKQQRQHQSLVQEYRAKHQVISASLNGSAGKKAHLKQKQNKK